MNTDFMKNHIKIIAVVIAVIIVGVAFWSYFESKQTDEAPDFTVTDIDGNPFTLSDFKDKKVVLLDFMSVTCASCKDEMPELVKIHKKFGDRIQMISIDIQNSDTDEELRDFMEEHNAKWRAARDTDGLISKYNVKSIVRLIIVDKEGIITFSHEGTSDAKKIAKELEDADEGTAEGVKISSGMGLSVLAIGAGIFAFFSPCAFPMLPGYMSFYLAKTSQADQGMIGDQAGGMVEGTDVQWEFEDEDRRKREKSELIRKGMWSGIATALGIVFLYLIIGLLVSISGELVKDYISALEPIIGLMLIILGILMVQNIPIGQYAKNAWITLKWRLFEKHKETRDWDADSEPKSPGFKDKLTVSLENLISRITKKDFSFKEAKEEGYFGLFMFGIGYGAASASCCFPLFLAIILAALDSGGAAEGFFIFFLYALSMAVLMVVVTIFVSLSRNTLLNKMRSATGKIELIGGISLQIVGLYLIWYSLNV